MPKDKMKGRGVQNRFFLQVQFPPLGGCIVPLREAKASEKGHDVSSLLGLRPQVPQRVY